MHGMYKKAIFFEGHGGDDAWQHVSISPPKADSKLSFAMPSQIDTATRLSIFAGLVYSRSMDCDSTQNPFRIEGLICKPWWTRRALQSSAYAVQHSSAVSPICDSCCTGFMLLQWTCRWNSYFQGEVRDNKVTKGFIKSISNIIMTDEPSGFCFNTPDINLVLHRDFSFKPRILSIQKRSGTTPISQSSWKNLPVIVNKPGSKSKGTSHWINNSQAKWSMIPRFQGLPGDSRWLHEYEVCSVSDSRLKKFVVNKRDIRLELLGRVPQWKQWMCSQKPCNYIVPGSISFGAGGRLFNNRAVVVANPETFDNDCVWTVKPWPLEGTEFVFIIIVGLHVLHFPSRKKGSKPWPCRSILVARFPRIAETWGIVFASIFDRTPNWISPDNATTWF